MNAQQVEPWLRCYSCGADAFLQHGAPRVKDEPHARRDRLALVLTVVDVLVVSTEVAVVGNAPLQV